MSRRKLKAGDLVRVRTREEILSTLDANGCLDGMPVMPEMLQLCGKMLRVAARAHKTCDTVNNTGGVWVDDAVHLEGARCDGSSHDGCQAACLIFWKSAWIERVPHEARSTDRDEQEADPAYELPRDWSYKSPPGTPDADIVYRCQATELPGFCRPMKWWDIRQYAEDLTSRNIGTRQLLRGIWHSTSESVTSLGVGYNAWKRFYNFLMRILGGTPFYWVTGTRSKTPSESIGLHAGDWVRVKSFHEIMETLDTNNKNRGMGFDTAEMSMHCGQTFQVDQRIHRFINDRTGKMVRFKEPTITLKGVYCSGERSNVRRFCPRAITPYWREIWLEKADDAPGDRTES
ncbi:hypothetical protein [Lentisalinibacter salinarum]|uniref:hypothetical protein n=1 Tax=Lentisalinibacter salinarum TaxID=2992239 RepID=UPI00386837F7